MAAVLALGDDAALCGISAGKLWDIVRDRQIPTEVVKRNNPRQLWNAKVRASRTLHKNEITEKNHIPVTTVARTLLDLGDVYTEYKLANAIHKAAFLGLFRPEDTYKTLNRNKRRHAATVLRRALALHEIGSAGTRSNLEDALLDLVIINALPLPLVNEQVNLGDESLEVDFRWTSAGLIVEADGPGHLRPKIILEDKRRDDRLIRAGYTVLRFTDSDIYANPFSMLNKIRDYL